ncbi:hypothetical protein ABBQ32_011168 [Trebouxia sp. C0010 RCD-2024]
MQSLQHAQRITSSAGCSTSGTAPLPHCPQSARSQVHGDCLYSHRHCAGPELHRADSVCITNRSAGRRKLPRKPTAIPCVRADVNDPIATEPLSITKFVAETCLPTRTGKYRVRAYRHSIDAGRTVTEPTCIMTGKPEGKENVVVRVHDACFTSEVLGSLKCDCAEQLKLAMSYIQEHPNGVIIYLQQEGRGIGLSNKIAAYSLQETGLDTVDANRALGLPDDCREYTSVTNILADLGIRSIKLMTNNPRKIELLRATGVKVTDRIPCIVEGQAFSQNYLDIKQSKMAHDFDGSYCYWNHDGTALLPNTQIPAVDLPIAPKQTSSDHS